MTQSRFPAGWDEERVRRVLEYLEGESPEEAVVPYESATHAVMEIPTELVAEVRTLIARRRAS